MTILSNLALIGAVFAFVFAATYLAQTVVTMQAIISGRRVGKATTGAVLLRTAYTALAIYAGLLLVALHLALGGALT